MTQILKYPPRAFVGAHVVELPINYEFLGVKVQANDPVLYIVGDPEEETIHQVYYCLYTGDELPEDADVALGTALLNNDTYVLHYFI